MHDPGVDADDGAGGDVVVADVDAALRDVAFEEEAEARVDAHCFLDDGVEVGEVGCGFLVGDWVA